MKFRKYTFSAEDNKILGRYFEHFGGFEVSPQACLTGISVVAATASGKCSESGVSYNVKIARGAYIPLPLVDWLLYGADTYFMEIDVEPARAQQAALMKTAGIEAQAS